MKLQTVKSVKEINIPGVAISLDYTDKQLKTITFSVGDKPICRAVLESYSLSLSFQRPADPETKDVYRVAGTVLGLPVSKDFESDWDAKQEAERLRLGVSEGEANITVEKVKANIED